MTRAGIQHVANEGGEPTAVIVPIFLWREIESERTAPRRYKPPAAYEF
jgi:hypothetical protein